MARPTLPKRPPAGGGPALAGTTPGLAPGSAGRDLGGVRAISRALQLVELIALAPSPSTIQELSARLDLPPSTTHRILQTLCALGYVTHYPETHRYGVGREVAEINRALTLRHDISDQARPHLAALSEASGETASLAVLYGARVLHLAQVQPASLVRISTPPGSSAPLHASAFGKVFLADFRPAMAQEATRGPGLPRFTERTIVDPAALTLELELVRVRGFALDDEELEPGARGLAAPVRGTSGVVIAAVGVSGPTMRVGDERLSDLAAQVQRTADFIVREVRAR